MQNQKFTPDDLVFIEWFKSIILEMEGYIIKKNSHTFGWTYSIETFWQYKSVDYSQQMLDAFILDLDNETKTYQYNIYSMQNDDARKIIYSLSQLTDKTSSYLKLAMLNLFEGDNTFFTRLLEYAHEKNDSELMFNIFKKHIHYGNVVDEKNSDSKTFAGVLYHYRKLASLNKDDVYCVAQSFIEHIQNSDIIINENNLIQVFLQVFSKKELPLLYQAFNIQKENICVNVENNDCDYAKITLSQKALISNKLYQHDIEQIIQLMTYLNLDFPSCQVSNFDNQYIDILVQKKEANSEKKIVMFFEQLVQGEYDLRVDELEKFKTLKDISKQINEMFYLDSVIKSPSSNKNKLKV
jgi:hypothetical protein